MPLFVPKDRKSLFRQFLAGMYDAVIITDPNGHVIEINPRAEEHFGYTQEEVVDRPISTFIAGLSTEVVQRIRRGLEENHRMLVDGNGICKGGRKFSCEVTISVIDLMDPSDLVFTVRNTERRRKLNERLRAKENAFDTANAALFACDREGRFTEVNRAFLDMFGLEDAEAARKHLFTDLMGDAPLPEDFKKALEGETSTVGVVAEAENEGREEIEVKLAPNRIGNRIRGVVGSILKV